MAPHPPSLLPALAPVFVTGGSGFVGRQLIADLVALGHPVRALARSPKAKATVEALGATAVDGSLADSQSLAAGMQGCAAIIHSAAKVETWGAWDDFLDATVHGTERVLTAARAAGVRRLVHVSTEAVLAGGAPLVNADERTPYPARPTGPYPRSKALAEQAVLAANSPELACMIVRPRFIWGAGDTTVLPNLVAAMRSGQWLWFGPDHRTSTCHVANVSHGIILAAQHGKAGEIYFLTDGEPVMYRGFITRLVATQGVTPPARNAPLWAAQLIAAAGETAWRLLKLRGRPPVDRTVVNLLFREVTVNDAKARADLGYRPVKSIDAGLRELRA